VSVSSSHRLVPTSPPWEGLRTRLLERSEALAATGDAPGAAILNALVESWWQEQQLWDAALRQAMMANHEINNALVGVSGNIQLLLMSAPGRQPGIRERLEVVLREAGRVERAARSLGERKAQLGIGSANIPNEEDDFGGHAAPAA
jgi:signal transduction histidine kinase